MAIENRKRDASVARRTQPIFAQSDFAEWKKWLSYDAVERPKLEELCWFGKRMMC